MNKNYQHVIEGISAEIAIDNIDTDQIIPTEYLKSIKKYGFGDFLFDGWRYKDEGNIQKDTSQRELNEDFILNIDPYKKSKILVVGKNFGCGSSREHAVWALRDFGIECIIAESFGDIFYNNCFKNGILPIQISQDKKNHVSEHIKENKNLRVDLTNQFIQLESSEIQFEIEESLKERIILGQDDIDITLGYANQIKQFESNRFVSKPWLK